jgi:hypothetical protein
MKATHVLCLVSCLVSAPDASPVKSSPDSSRCEGQRDFFDSDGNYLKTGCILRWPQTQDSACTEVNMNLFIIDSSESKQGALDFVTDNFATGQGSTLWINGKGEYNGYWYRKDSTKYPMWSELSGLFESSYENCLVLSAYYDFIVEPYSCNKRMFPVCEYIKTDDKEMQKSEACPLFVSLVTRMFFLSIICIFMF